jgi:hypothetical protein
VSSLRITYRSHPDSTSEAEQFVLANIYRFILDCHARKKAAGRSGQDDAKETHHARARSILPP